jgi:hypothetical protein
MFGKHAVHIPVGDKQARSVFLGNKEVLTTTHTHCDFSKKKEMDIKIKTYNSRYSLVVTHPTTNLPI